MPDCPSPTAAGREDRCGRFAFPPRCTTVHCSMPDVEVRYCPLGPPTTGRRVWYAWCAECQHVRKSNAHCPLVQVDA